MAELYTQIVEIERLLNETQHECQGIVSEKHHPDYPKSLFDLMAYIARSKWIYGEYQKHDLKDVIANVDNASLEQVRCAITSLNRSEKWCTGSWINVMKDRTLEPLIKRGKELTASDKTIINKVLTKFGSTKTQQANVVRPASWLGKITRCNFVAKHSQFPQIGVLGN